MRARPWVLVADGGYRLGGQGRSAVAAVRALDAGGYNAAVTVSARDSIAAASRHCRRRVQVPRSVGPGFVAAVRAEMARGGYLTCLPASDDSLLALQEGMEHLVDKVQLAKQAERAGIQMPPSRHFGSAEELLSAAHALSYPVVVKPTTHRYQPFRADAPAPLEARLPDDGEVVVQPYVTEPVRMVSGVMWDGHLVQSAHARWIRSWKIGVGNACAAETIEPDVELEERLVELLEGYDGVFNAQFIGPYLLDVHVRVYATHPLALAGGVNLIASYCDLLRGVPVPERRARAGAFYRWVEGDLRHIWTSLRAGTMSVPAALAALHPRPGAAHSTESLADPGPMLARVRFALKRTHLSEQERRVSARA